MIHMAKKSRASWKKKDSMIKEGDNVMEDGLPTDIVIPCDSLPIDFYKKKSLTITHSVMGPTGVGKSSVCSS